MFAWQKRSLMRFLTIFVLFALLEPLYEIGCLMVHNMIFNAIADINFTGVSLGSLLSFVLNLPAITLFQQYFVMMPWSIPMAFFVAMKAHYQTASLQSSILLAFLILVITTIITVLLTAPLVDWTDPIILLSYAMSCLYYFVSVMLAWASLRLMRLI